MKTLSFIFMTMVLFTMVGCNAVYLYESDKISLTLEGKPADASEPVSGNLGIKQHVVLIVPSSQDASDWDDTEKAQIKSARDAVFLARANLLSAQTTFNATKPEDRTAPILSNLATTKTAFLDARANYISVVAQAGEPKGDAVSALSAFYFNMVPTPNAGDTVTKTVTIDSAFITGDPAELMTSDDAKNAMRALSGSSVLGNENTFAALKFLAYDFEKRVKASNADATALFNSLNHDYSVVGSTYPITRYSFTAATVATPATTTTPAVPAVSAYADIDSSDENGKVVAEGTSKIDKLLDFADYLLSCREVDAEIIACQTKITSKSTKFPDINPDLNSKAIFLQNQQIADQKLKQIQNDPDVINLLQKLNQFYFSK